MLPDLGRASFLERARRASGGRGSARPCMGGGAQPPRILGKSGNISGNTAFPLSAGARNEPPEPRPDPPRAPQGDRGGVGAPGGGNFAAICGTSGFGARQNAAPAGTGRDTLPLFAAVAAPGPRKPALPLEREANPPGFAGKWHGRVRYFRSEAPCFWRFPGRRGDLAREAR